MKPWLVLDSEYVLESPWLKLRRDRVEREGGVVIDPFYVIEYPDWSCVLPMTGDGRVVMVEQYRHGVRRFSLELPAGIIDGGESPVEAAARELREETGFAAHAWEALGVCAPEPSKQPNYAHIFVARDLERVTDQELDDTESIRVVNVPIDALDDLIGAGKIVHGIHLYAILLARNRGLI